MIQVFYGSRQNVRESRYGMSNHHDRKWLPENTPIPPSNAVDSILSDSDSDDDNNFRLEVIMNIELKIPLKLSLLKIMHMIDMVCIAM